MFPRRYRTARSRLAPRMGKSVIVIDGIDYSGNIKPVIVRGIGKDHKTISRVGLGFIVPILANSHPARGYQPHPLTSGA